MQIPKEALDLAHATGEWSKFGYDMDWQDIALDSTFWQALIIGQKWNTVEDRFGDWIYYAHRFYDLILNNQPTDTFWQELLH